MSNRNRIAGPWWLWTTAAGAIVGLALYGSAPAHADPFESAAICATLDQNPTVAGMRGVAYGLLAHGDNVDQAGEAIAEAIVNNCPRYAPLLRAAATGTDSGVAL